MYVLAIETTGAYASVALAESRHAKADPAQWENARGEMTLLAAVHGNDRFSHLQNLTPQIQQVLDECQLSIGDVDVLAVSVGPGSFTGIRIGVSTTRALAQVTGKPCVAVSSLEALAIRTRQLHDGQEEVEVLICPILDARRSQVYGGGYFVKDGETEEKIKAGPYTIEEFLELAKGFDKVLFAGDGVDAYREKIEEMRPEGTAFASVYQDAEQVAALGIKLAEEGRCCSFGELKPDYMRLAEAERKLREKQNG
ncbi:MAG: tRNA (adenosine(37)-N6)-threonylcarbamoyltransferase complex dimerization subunit type 1 TsaB [Firmicutes bacterium]|nr:tRNA (adenosine(37)-N6)-threonylcarbamoyltransferase complex dimerization subunit type 1 TsaB [Bacillota bacterium]